MNQSTYQAILADINATYLTWEEGRATSPSADDLVYLASRRHSTLPHDCSLEELADLIYNLQIDGICGNQPISVSSSKTRESAFLGLMPVSACRICCA